jgi:hypothetical protein
MTNCRRFSARKFAFWRARPQNLGCAEELDQDRWLRAPTVSVGPTEPGRWRPTPSSQTLRQYRRDPGHRTEGGAVMKAEARADRTTPAMKRPSSTGLDASSYRSAMLSRLPIRRAELGLF